MDNTIATKKIEAIACAGASLVLGAFLASSAEHLVMQVLMMSLPPASLFLAIRRSTTSAPVDVVVEVQGQVEAITFEDVTAGLEFDILTRAS